MIVGLKRAELDRLEAGTISAVKARLRPKDAASIILFEQSGGSLRFLFGKRRANLAFMPGQFVFPGGRRERLDGNCAASGALNPTDERRLLSEPGARHSSRRARGLAVAAIREFYEETGMMIGQPDAASPLGFVPDLSALRHCARAITPPSRVRRFDTCFFMASILSVQAVSPGGPPHAEFDELRWATPDEAVQMDLPEITRTILAQAVARLGEDPALTGETPVPQFRMRHGRFVREWA
jgi:8-oxo-dGTP pyrophosphatase MutT (NUDIX family)